MQLYSYYDPDSGQIMLKKNSEAEQQLNRHGNLMFYKYWETKKWIHKKLFWKNIGFSKGSFENFIEILLRNANGFAKGCRISSLDRRNKNLAQKKRLT